jgi:hypothetical protein
MACASAFIGFAAEKDSAERVQVHRIPEGLQPQMTVDDTGHVHLIYYAGDPRHGDVFYAKSTDGGMSLSRPLRVNSEPGSAIATGTIRGGSARAWRSRPRIRGLERIETRRTAESRLRPTGDADALRPLE